MMKKSIVAVLLLFAVSVSVYGQRYHNVIDKTVALVGNSMITISQIEAEASMMQFQGYVSDRDLRCEVLENMMISKLFYTQAQLDSIAVNPAMVEAALNERINNVLTQLGGEEGVEKYFGMPLHKLREDWKEKLQEQSLVQEMQKKVVESVTEVTPKQVEQFYKKAPKDSLPIIPTRYQYRQIVVYPDQKKAEVAVRERLLDFRNRIIEGEKFSMLATLYSQDPGSAMKGGELGMASRSIFWPEFSDAAMALKEGQVSQIIKTPDGFHLIQLIKKDGDMFNARHILLRPEYDEKDRKAAFSKLDSIRNQILSDSLSFDQAARIYSEDPQSRTNGGLVADPMTGAPMFEVDQLKPADYSMLSGMKPGDVSKPFESADNEGRSGNTIYKIIRFENVQPSHVATYDNDFNILMEVTKAKLSSDAVEKFIKEKQEITYIVIDPLFHKCEFRRDGWFK